MRTKNVPPRFDTTLTDICTPDDPTLDEVLVPENSGKWYSLYNTYTKTKHLVQAVKIGPQEVIPLNMHGGLFGPVDPHFWRRFRVTACLNAFITFQEVSHANGV